MGKGDLSQFFFKVTFKPLLQKHTQHSADTSLTTSYDGDGVGVKAWWKALATSRGIDTPAEGYVSCSHDSAECGVQRLAW